jgi:hypothetical protein
LVGSSRSSASGRPNSLAFRLVAVLVADDAFELAEAHALSVGHLRFRVQLLALFERAPQAVVAHDHRIDHPEGVERVLVLAQHADLGRADHGAALRRLLAGQEFHEG